MDAVTDHRNGEITINTSSQIGKTQVLKNIIGYYIDQDPSPILMLEPTLQMVRDFSKDRLASMLRDTPCLQGKVKEARSKDSSNEILHKTFPGGHITLAGANSAASLSSRPIRILLLDEVDRYPPSAGTEGDPVKLAVKRTRTFWNRKIIQTSSPKIAGLSRIQAAFEASDQRHYWVPCPRCGEFQVLIFSDRSIYATIAQGRLRFDSHNGSWAHYECGKCKGEISEGEKLRMIARGEWRPTHPDRIGHAGFHLSELYSTFSSWKEIANEFLEAQKQRETLKVWINTCLGETFEEEEALTVSDEELAGRVEDYEKVPPGAMLLTAAVDVQDDRLESLVLGWGVGEECWLIDHRQIYGDPDRKDTWDLLEGALESTFANEAGMILRPHTTFVDSGGHYTQEVYRFTRSRQKRRVYAIRGSGGRGRPLIGKATRNNKERAIVITLGVDDAKRTIYDRLSQVEKGPGYFHFNGLAGDDFFQQLTAEKQVIVQSKGFPTKVWKLKEGRRRNEILDLYVYNLAALRFMNVNWEKVKISHERELIKAMERVEIDQDEAPEQTIPKRPPARIRRPWINRWRY